MWLALALLAAAEAGVVRHAVVVGANDGGGLLEPLRYAEDDAARFARVLTELGDFHADRVTVLYAPDREALDAALERHRALSAAREDDLFLFYYSGHADARGLRIGEEVYSYPELKAEFRAIEADVRLGVLDACRSGAITRLKGATLSAPLIAQEPLAAEGEAWMTASSADEMAQESEILRGGFFTHYLVSGMRGAADAGDGVVDLDELYRYTFDRVVEHTGGTELGAQHPHFEFMLSGAGEIGLTDVRRAQATLVLPPEIDGYIQVIRMPDRVPVLELAKQPGAAQKVGVPPGTYLLRRRIDDRLEEVTVGVDTGAVLTVDRWGEVDPETVAARGGNPALSTLAAVGLSAFPGGGQMYQDRPYRGAAYFVGTTALFTGFVASRGSRFPDMGTGLGIALWGAAVADAAHHANPRLDEHPTRGITLSTTTGMGATASHSYAMTLSGDLIVREGLSVGIDRAGWLGGPEGWDASFGLRAMQALDWKRWRPGVFVMAGLRSGRHDDPDPGAEQYANVDATRLTFGVGTSVRYYVVPRYFIELDARTEKDPMRNDGSVSIGMGVHLGR